ncbi:hypothetical protein [Thermocatellispora tengchongensis]|uniref:hypothetical protein n=1 Tax=Thermocatellispora tengchongensis TaxID=1073253 RepID=UPI00363EA836
MNSGNFSNANGSTATANSVDSGNASNGPQSISVPTPRMALPIAARPCHPGHRRCRGKGNSWNSGNYRAKGRQISSGNFGNANGSIDSNNTYGGGNNANGPLCVKCRWYGPS